MQLNTTVTVQVVFSLSPIRPSKGQKETKGLALPDTLPMTAAPEPVTTTLEPTTTTTTPSPTPPTTTSTTTAKPRAAVHKVRDAGRLVSLFNDGVRIELYDTNITQYHHGVCFQIHKSKLK